jgi:aldose 1-epimerase
VSDAAASASTPSESTPSESTPSESGSSEPTSSEATKKPTPSEAPRSGTGKFAPRPPTGEQVRISHGDSEAVTVAVAAGLRTCSLNGQPVIDGFAEFERPSGGRGQTLVPWPNRIDGGRYRFDGVDQQLPLTEPARGNASHGLARWVEWHVAERDDDRVTWEYVIPPQPGWPTSLLVHVTYTIGPDGLTVATTAHNVGSAPCPYGTGAHPYLTVGTPTVDTAVVRLPAGRSFQTDDRGIPTGSSPVDGSTYDLRTPQQLGDRVLDTAYADLERDDDGRWRVRMAAPGDDSAVELWADEAYGYAQLFTGDGLPGGERRRGLAVEPMTCPANAFVTGEGVVRLEPGASHTARWGISRS